MISIHSIRNRPMNTVFSLKKEKATSFYSIPTASLVHGVYKQLQEKTPSSLRSWLEKTSEVLLELTSTPSFAFEEALSSPPLQIPSLPYPPFHTQAPIRKFYHPKKTTQTDLYAPECLLPEVEEDPCRLIEQNQRFLEYFSRNFPLQGILKQERNGHLYLSISPGFSIKDPILSFLCSQEESCFVSHLGLHSTVFTSHEILSIQELGIAKEIGKTFPFQIEGCYVAEIHSDPLLEKAWYLSVASEELSEIRERYLLPRSLGGHGFHATLLLQKRSSFKKAKPPLCRLNVSCFAA